MWPVPVFLAAGVLLMLGVIDRSVNLHMSPMEQSSVVARGLSVVEGAGVQDDAGAPQPSLGGSPKLNNTVAERSHPIMLDYTTPPLEIAVLKWTYDWAATAASGGQCRCEAVGWGEHKSEEECLKSFAANEFESCLHEDQGISQTDCKFAVATVASIHNSHCVDLCDTLIALGNMDFEKFYETCSFEKYQVTSRGEVLLLSPYCFSNSVYGHSDLSVAAGSEEYVIAVGAELGLTSASMCQEQCQLHDDCVSWIWRGVPKSTSRTLDGNGNTKNTAGNTKNTAGNTKDTAGNTKDSRLLALRKMASSPSINAVAEAPTYNCLLKTQAIVDAATSAVLPVGQLNLGRFPPSDDPLWAQCDISRKWEEIYKQFGSTSPDDTCECGCVWESFKHLSGPKLCSRNEATSSVFVTGGTGTGTDSSEKARLLE